MLKITKIILEEIDHITKEVLKKSKTPIVKTQFNMNVLKKLKDYTDMRDYANLTLPYVGMGSSRIVFKVNDESALKIALNEKGKEQNKAEKNTCGAHPELVSQVISAASDGSWILSQFAEPMTKEEFKKLTGIKWGEFYFGIKYLSTQNPSLELHYNSVKENHFFKTIVEAINACGYIASDIIKLDSWGILNNRPIIIDSGFTRAVYEAFYQAPEAGPIQYNLNDPNVKTIAAKIKN